MTANGARSNYIEGLLNMDPDLRGRVVLVTGAARRIGQTLALALAGRGADIGLHYKTSVRDAQQVDERIKALGRCCVLIQGDLSDPAVPGRLLSKVAKTFNRPVDILINNASVFEQGQLATTELDQWQQMQSINLRAPFLLAQTMAEQLPDSVAGDIINMNDSKALRPRSDHSAYTISKYGLHGLTHNLALALAPRIRVNELALGSVLPPERKPGKDDYAHTRREDIPSGDFGSIDHVTQAMLYLLGPAAGTGQTLYVDGGLHLT